MPRAPEALEPSSNRGCGKRIRALANTAKRHKHQRAPGVRAIAAYAWLGAVAGVSLGCSAAAPLMHPAHTLPQDKVNIGLGLTQSFGDGDQNAVIANAQQAGSPGGSQITEEEFVEGAVRSATVPLQLSGVAVGRVGLGDNWEAGITATGRTVRVDGRHSFESGGFALSLGAGGSAVYRLGESRPGEETMAVGRFEGTAVGYGAGGFGLDVPILAGWRNSTELINIWIGARGGYERMWGNMDLNGDGGTMPLTPAGVESNRWYGGGLLGAAMGLDPIWIRFEFEAAYHSVAGTVTLPAEAGEPTDYDAQFGAFTFTPSAAILGKF